MGRRKGLRDIYIAKVTSNTALLYTTEAPVKLARAISAKVDVKKTSEKLYSDDSVEDIVSSLEGIEIEISTNDLSPEQEALLLGSEYANGFLVDSKDDMANEVAIGWRSKRTDGKWELVWYYCGKFSQGYSDAYETETDKLSTQTPTLKGTFYAREKDGNFRIKLNEQYILDTQINAKTAVTNWFTEVQEAV